MSIITKMRKQTAIYWAQSGVDNFGQPSYSAGVDISVRWEDKTEEFQNAEGETEMSKALVYVDRDMSPGDLLYLGALSSSIDDTTPRTNDGAWEVKRFEKLPNFKATEFLRSAFL